MAVETRTLVPSGAARDMDTDAPLLAAELNIDTATVTVKGGKVETIVIVSDNVADPTAAIDNAITAVAGAGGYISLSGYPDA